MPGRGDSVDPDEPIETVLTSGSVLAARYTLVDPLGRGSFGAVWRAIDAVHADHVAVKLLPVFTPSEDRSVRRELTALRIARVPGVVGLRDEGRDGDVWFLVMDLAEGPDFPGVEAPVAWSALRGPLVSLLTALARLHGAGLVHRDLKPANVKVTDRGVLLLDVGLASGRTLRSLVDSGSFEGSPAYAAPEQRLAMDTGPQADLYAVGAMAFEALTGRLPFEEVPLDELLFGAMDLRPPSLTTLQVDAPPEVLALLDQLLEPQVAARPGSAHEVLRRLGVDVEQVALPPDLPDPASRADLGRLFHGPSLLLHLPEDAADALWRRTGGHHAHVVMELRAWERAGLVTLQDGRYRIDRDALDRLAEGERVRVDRPVLPDHLSAQARVLSSWLEVAWPHARLGHLAAAPSLAGLDVGALVDELVREGHAWRLDDDVVGTHVTDAAPLYLLSSERRTAIAELIATFAEDDPARVPLLRSALLQGIGDPTDLLPAVLAAARSVEAQTRFRQGLVLAEWGLGLARASEALDHERDFSDALTLLSLRSHLPEVQERVLRHLEAVRVLDDRTQQLTTLLRAARAGQRREAERAIALLDELDAFDEPELEIWRQSLRVSSSFALGPEAQLQALHDLEAWAQGTPQRLARWRGWRAGVHYRLGEYDEAIAILKDILEDAPDPRQTLGHRVTLALNLSESGRRQEAMRLAAALAEEAADGRHTLLETRMRTVERAAAYRAGEVRAPHLELVQATLTAVDSEAGPLALNEAAFAWRAGDLRQALRLASTAEQAFHRGRHTLGRLLAQALQAALGDHHAGARARQDLQSAPLSSVPELSVQALGLLAIGGHLTLDAGIAGELLAAVNQADTRREEVLSMDEACAAVRAHLRGDVASV